MRSLFIKEFPLCVVLSLDFISWVESFVPLVGTVAVAGIFDAPVAMSFLSINSRLSS
jgi:hypothetical protein